jgi:hypothetical protein
MNFDVRYEIKERKRENLGIESKRGLKSVT